MHAVPMPHATILWAASSASAILDTVPTDLSVQVSHFMPTPCRSSQIMLCLSVGLDVDECAELPCHEDADCIDTDGSFECTCRTGYSGDALNNCSSNYLHHMLQMIKRPTYVLFSRY